GHRFFLGAMRLDGLGATLDLNEKLKLRRGLEELRAAHTNGLILTEKQSQPALDIVAAAGMVAMVELEVAPVELVDPSRFVALVSRVAHAGNVYRSHPGLCGYLINCSPEAAAPSGSRCRFNPKKLKRRFRTLVQRLKQHDPDALVAINHR